jgi:hypothetical protein
MEKVKKEHKEKILEIIKKAGSEEYTTSWDERGIPHSKKNSEIKRGRTSKAAGQRFELKVRQDLENKEWIVSRWCNNVEFMEEKEECDFKKE